MQPKSDLFSESAMLVRGELDRLIPAEGGGPRTLRDAMRWCLLSGGKYFRPSLLLAVGNAFGAPAQRLVRTAAAVEMIHTYSLIHDDLPAMDDDDLRRGREACHIKFGEAAAILAGDALQALAFQVIASDTALDESTRVKLVEGLARSAARMVSGQQLDLEGEGKRLSISEIEQIHANKTGALIEFAAVAGAMIAGASDDDVARIQSYGKSLGLLFQITDDVLDVTKTTKQLGKTAGKDASVDKATYPAILGIDKTYEKIAEVHAEALADVCRLNADVSRLKDIADFLVKRES